MPGRYCTYIQYVLYVRPGNGYQVERHRDGKWIEDATRNLKMCKYMPDYQLQEGEIKYMMNEEHK
jgi:hypothetical protein